MRTLCGPGSGYHRQPEGWVLWRTRSGRACGSSLVPSQPFLCLCLQGEPGPPGQTGPEGPGGQQGSPGTQGRTVQGPVVGVASLPFLPAVPTHPSSWAPLCPGPEAQPVLLLQGPPGVKGEKGDHGLPGLQVGAGGSWGRASSSSGSDLAPAWPLPVLFQGYPGHQGVPGKVGLQGPKVGEKPARRGVSRWRLGWGFPLLSPHSHPPCPTVAWPGQGNGSPCGRVGRP